MKINTFKSMCIALLMAGYFGAHAQITYKPTPKEITTPETEKTKIGKRPF